MTDDPFAQLAARDVPPVPEDFEIKVHARVNDALLGTHLVDFFLRAAPLALLEFGRVAIGMGLFTLTGDYPHDDRRKRRHRDT